MTKYWVVVANSTSCRIFQCVERGKDFFAVAALQHIESKLKNQELVSDRQGEYRVSNSSGSAYQEMTDPHEHEKSAFAKQLAAFLENARNKHLYSHIIMIAPSHFLGLIGKHLNKQTSRLVCGNLQKNYTDYKDQEISSLLHDKWREMIPL